MYFNDYNPVTAAFADEFIKEAGIVSQLVGGVKRGRKAFQETRSIREALKSGAKHSKDLATLEALLKEHPNPKRAKLLKQLGYETDIVKAKDLARAEVERAAREARKAQAASAATSRRGASVSRTPTAAEHFRGRRIDSKLKQQRQELKQQVQALQAQMRDFAISPAEANSRAAALEKQIRELYPDRADRLVRFYGLDKRKRLHYMSEYQNNPLRLYREAYGLKPTEVPSPKKPTVSTKPQAAPKATTEPAAAPKPATGQTKAPEAPKVTESKPVESGGAATTDSGYGYAPWLAAGGAGLGIAGAGYLLGRSRRRRYDGYSQQNPTFGGY